MWMNLSVYRFHIPNKIDYCGNISPPLRALKWSGRSLNDDPFGHLLIVSQWLVFRQAEKSRRKVFFIRRWLVFICRNLFAVAEQLKSNRSAQSPRLENTWLSFHRSLCRGISVDFPSLRKFSFLFPSRFSQNQQNLQHFPLSKHKSFGNIGHR